jgi:F420-non-reducing hydrogenase iron-sulfur subunit
MTRSCLLEPTVDGQSSLGLATCRAWRNVGTLRPAPLILLIDSAVMKTRPRKTCVFYCSNYLEPGRFSALRRDHAEDMIQAISLPCSGKVDIPYLIKAFETGADGVAIVTCKPDECRHFEGNLRARKRAEGVEALLEEMGVEGGRMTVMECGRDDVEAILGRIGQFLERLRDLPPLDAPRLEANQRENIVV